MNQMATVRNASAFLFLGSMLVGTARPSSALEFCWTQAEPCGGEDEGSCESDCDSRASGQCWGSCAMQCSGTWTLGVAWDDCSTPPHQSQFSCQCS